MNDVMKDVEAFNRVFQEENYPANLLKKYTLLECLSDHGERLTFLAKERAQNHFVIIKLFATNEHTKFSADIYKSLRHEGIPEYFDFYQNKEWNCVVRDYIEGISLKEYYLQNELERNEIVSICLKLSDTLIYLHSLEQPIIHRDIKPENIIIKENKDVILIDFDVARTVKDDAETDTVFWGTKGYAPPEQYGFFQTDNRSDIYSFGILLRYLLTGNTRANKNIRLYKPLQKIIDKCTSFSPEKRYKDIKTVKKDLLKANPKSQFIRMAVTTACVIAGAALLSFTGYKIYKAITYSPFTDDSIIASVMPDEERQDEAVKYLQDKYGTHIFDNKSDFITIGIFKDVLVDVYGMDEDYARIGAFGEPPEEDPEHFMPWPLDDNQDIDRNYMYYFVTKIYWPEVVSDWSSLKEDTGVYPGILVSEKWCEKYNIMTGVNRPYDLSLGEAAIALANADKVYEAMKGK